jgi:hypothetical protein
VEQASTGLPGQLETPGFDGQLAVKIVETFGGVSHQMVVPRVSTAMQLIASDPREQP